MIATSVFAISPLTGFVGYYGYWRFSDLRSVQCATSDRSAMGGLPQTRCSIATRS